MSYYTNVSAGESSSNDDNESSMLSTLSSSLKPVKMQNKKRKNDTEPKVKMSKAGKQRTESIETYKDALASVISKGNIEDNIYNSITLTEGNYTYTIRCPVAPKFDDYYVIQHYKTSVIKDIPSLERWKHSEASVKLYTSNNFPADNEISIKINELIRTILNRCSSDPKRKIVKNSKK
ncbi:uncharacterized protein LOC126553826 isoform X1 [Aphis gossypii]|uniref:uncharacterized protein LOC126553826 isoform X1 n=1 Tax=Aphis gossypii TaxID=80765 RepID=UPI0021590881|nr:uncharacterized protein LOC126553826 isoform X1 [Aphis gossypii]XP_050064897.1 uncharacterized protein LOC126553826 isoform X1 [Aphis gossypii]